MKDLTNNQANTLLFLTNGKDVSDSTKARFTQLGGSGSVSLDISIVASDCFSVTYEVILSGDAIKNGLHVMEILDSQDNLLLTTTVKASGNNSIDNYMVYDDDEHTDFIVKQPTGVTFSSGFITWSNDNNEGH